MEVVTMQSYGLFLVILLCFTWGFRATAGNIILPETPSQPSIPICTSYSGLCHLLYNLTETESHEVLNSQQQICRCPGRPCDTDWTDTGRSIIKVFKNAGQEVEVKMNYCTLHQPDKVCRQNEVALITRGRGPFTFEIADDFRCRCYRQMYAHRSWRDGDYNYIEYSCGKPRCSHNRSPTTDCMRIMYDSSTDSFTHDYLCRCRRHEECIGGPIPSPTRPETIRTCQRITPAELDRRRSVRRQYRNIQQH